MPLKLLPTIIGALIISAIILVVLYVIWGKVVDLQLKLETTKQLTALANDIAQAEAGTESKVSVSLPHVVSYVRITEEKIPTCDLFKDFPDTLSNCKQAGSDFILYPNEFVTGCLRYQVSSLSTTSSSAITPNSDVYLYLQFTDEPATCIGQDIRGPVIFSTNLQTGIGPGGSAILSALSNPAELQSCKTYDFDIAPAKVKIKTSQGVQTINAVNVTIVGLTGLTSC